MYLGFGPQRAYFTDDSRLFGEQLGLPLLPAEVSAHDLQPDAVRQDREAAALHWQQVRQRETNLAQAAFLATLTNQNSTPEDLRELLATQLEAGHVDLYRRFGYQWSVRDPWNAVISRASVAATSRLDVKLSDRGHGDTQAQLAKLGLHFFPRPEYDGVNLVITAPDKPEAKGSYDLTIIRPLPKQRACTSYAASPEPNDGQRLHLAPGMYILALSERHTEVPAEANNIAGDAMEMLGHLNIELDKLQAGDMPYRIERDILALRGKLMACAILHVEGYTPPYVVPRLTAQPAPTKEKPAPKPSAWQQSVRAWLARLRSEASTKKPAQDLCKPAAEPVTTTSEPAEATATS